ncbi:MAG: DUF3540 domain-containing protein [Pseudomonadota bacterium]
MENIRPIIQNTLPQDYVGAGTITSVQDGAPYCMLRVVFQSRSLEVLATKAAGLVDEPVAGDRVLCVSGGEDTVYITMILEKAKKAAVNGEAMSMSEKAKSKIINKKDRQVFAVYNKRGELIFEYDPKNDRSRVIMESGSLDVAAPLGDISFSAGGRIRLESCSVEMNAKSAKSIQSSRLILGKFKTELQSENVNIKSAKNRFELAEVDYIGKTLMSRVSRAKLNWGRVETLVDTLVQKARTSFTMVEELSQTKAGRMRTLVAGAFRLKAERAKLKTDKSVDIDGERINLG